MVTVEMEDRPRLIVSALGGEGRFRFVADVALVCRSVAAVSRPKTQSSRVDRTAKIGSSRVVSNFQSDLSINSLGVSDGRQFDRIFLSWAGWKGRSRRLMMAVALCRCLHYAFPICENPPRRSDQCEQPDRPGPHPMPAAEDN